MCQEVQSPTSLGTIQPTEVDRFTTAQIEEGFKLCTALLVVFMLSDLAFLGASGFEV